jgi:glutaryl-CoA dehydrogenase (non-decarboxylating)
VSDSPRGPVDGRMAPMREAFREFVLREISPNADRFDREERVSADAIGKIARAGYLGALVPVENGGLGMDMVTLGVLHEEVGRGCSSVRSLLTVQSMVAYALLKYGSKHNRVTWLPKIGSGEIITAFALSEPGAGSDVSSMEMSATRRGKHFVLNGCKKWTTFGQIANLLLVFAKCDGRITAFLVERDRAGLSIEPIAGMLGTRASQLAQLVFTDCEIPEENLIGGVGFGMATVAGTALDVGRYSVACGCVGIAQASLDASLQYAESRRQFKSPLKDHQLVSDMLSQMVVNTKAARLLCQHAGRLKDAGDPATISETLVAKYFASTIAVKAAADAVQIHGAHGCSSESPVQRYFRDAKVMEIIEGSSQMQMLMIAKEAYALRGMGL